MSKLECAADLAEEALFHTFEVSSAPSRPAEAAAWRRERDAIYARDGIPEREREFRALTQRWFERLDLAAPIRAALAMCPAASRALSVIHLRRVVRVRDEGSELYASNTSEREIVPRLVLGLRAESFADPTALFGLALREFLYADDMLDTQFGYQPELPARDDSNGAALELVRDRFGVLWEARVEGRAGRIVGSLRVRRPPQRFARAFASSLSSADIETLFERASSGALLTYTALVEAATLPEPPVRAA